MNLRSLATSLVVASFLSSILVYPLIPEGLSRFFLASNPLWLALFLLPVLMLLALLLFRGKGHVRWVFVIVLILSLLHGAVLFDNTGRVADLGITILMVISIGLGIMMVVLGYFGTKAKPNLAFGVRTKWALSNDEVWKRSNLLGGKLLLIVGFAFIITAFPAPFLFSSHDTYSTAFGIMFVLLFFGWAIIAIWYSYRVYKEVVGNGENMKGQ
ncbi:SdpI family protein [Shouchella clausii]|uniref:SdpI family protein n=1 Tax=Shouchella clausii TaxID=79880 RepID=UPI00289A27C3|nr:SdpI family protein [Shouchella clausii]